MGDDSERRRQVSFDCCNEVEQYKCKTCPSFLTIFLASLKHHQCNGHTNETSEQNVYKCLKCLFVSNSKYLMGRHSYFSQCATRNENERKERFVQYRSSQSDLRPKSAIQEYKFESELYQAKFKEKSSIKSQECAQDASKFALKSSSVHSKSGNNPSFTCYHCLYKFKRRSGLIRHIRTQHSRPEDIQWFKCHHCLFETKHKDALKVHLKTRHSKPEDIQWFKCDQCPYKGKEKGNLVKHFKLRHSSPEDKCGQCSHKSTRKRDLKQKIKLQHVKPEDIQWFKCYNCPFKAKHKRALKMHMKTRHSRPEDIQWFKCDQCPYKCKRKRYLKTHVKRHSGPEDRFKCDHCPLKFKKEGGLNRHIASRHSKPKDVQ